MGCQDKEAGYPPLLIPTPIPTPGHFPFLEEDKEGEKGDVSSKAAGYFPGSEDGADSPPQAKESPGAVH